MAEQVFKQPFFSIEDSTPTVQDLSDHVRAITLSYSAELQDITASGDGTRTMLAGLIDWSIDIEFNQDYDANEIDDVFFDLVGAASSAIELRPSTDAVGATNPKFTGEALVESYQPMGGTIGDAHTTTVTLRPAGALTRATS